MVWWVTSCCPRGTGSSFPLHYTVAIALTPGKEQGLQYPASTSVLIGQCKCYKAVSLPPHPAPSPPNPLFLAVFRSKEGKGEQTSHYLVSWLVPRRGNGSPQEKDGACQPKASTPPLIHLHQNQCVACWGNCSSVGPRDWYFVGCSWRSVSQPLDWRISSVSLMVLTLSPLSENFIKIHTKILMCIKILLAQILYLHA